MQNANFEIHNFLSVSNMFKNCLIIIQTEKFKIHSFRVTFDT